MPATTWALTMVSDKVEDGTAVNNTLRQIFAAIGSSMVVVMLAVLAAVICVTGYWIGNIRVETPWLFPFGLITDSFFSADYFPIAPYLGFFLVGGVLGRRVYKDRKTRFPQVSENLPVLRFFRFCGRHSLSIYLVHQPLLTGLMYLGMILKS